MAIARLRPPARRFLWPMNGPSSMLPPTNGAWGIGSATRRQRETRAGQAGQSSRHGSGSIRAASAAVIGTWLVAALFAAPALADSIPAPSGSSWTASGEAKIGVPSEGAAILTPDAPNSAGSVVYNAPLHPESLTVSFVEGMSCSEEGFGEGTCNGADGMAFDVLDASGLSGPPAVGEPGGTLGFYPNAGLAITLTQNSVPWGCYPADHFIGIADSAPPFSCPLHYIKTVAGVPNFYNAENQVEVTLNWSTETVAVSINGTQYLTYTLPSSDPLPTSAYIGFSAGTGNGAEEHWISDTSLSYSLPPGSSPGPKPTPPPNPNPGPAPPLGPIGPPPMGNISCTPSTPPRAVAILITGLGSSLPMTQSYNPLHQNYCGLANGTARGDLADMRFMARESFDHTSAGPIRPTNLTDSVASHGAVLLPFSYDGAALSGPPKHPIYQVAKFSSDTPGAVSPSDEANIYLLQLVHQIHSIWPRTAIFVIGHSEGGLVAEQLFEHHSLSELQGVKGIYSLDSPINGVAGSSFQDTFVGLCAVLATSSPDCGFPISPQLLRLYFARWNTRGSLDRTLLQRDNRMHDIYTPVGTPGDFLYQSLDSTWSMSCPGIETQVLWYVTPCGALEAALGGHPVAPKLGAPPDWITREPSSYGTPSSPGKLLVSHEFVMQSADSIEHLSQAVARFARGFTPSAGSSRLDGRASGAAATSLVHRTVLSAAAYEATVSAALAQHVTRSGSSVTVLGRGFGITPGRVRFLGARGKGLVAASVESWTPDELVVQLPAEAHSGPVVVETSEGSTTIAGIIAILARNNRSRVRRLVHLRATADAFDGNSLAVVVRAIGRHGHPVKGAQIQVLAGAYPLQARTSKTGTATFHLLGFGCSRALAISGSASARLRLCWHQPPKRRLRLRVVHRRGSIVVQARVFSGTHPVASDALEFRVIGPPCAHLAPKRSRTNRYGNAETRVRGRCASPVLVEVTDARNTLVRATRVTVR
jgi:hypothetical protein